MKLLYDFFAGNGGTAYNLASNIANALKRRFDIPQDVDFLITTIQRQINVVRDAIAGDASWTSIGSYIWDLATGIAAFIPALRVIDIAGVLWDWASLL